MTRRVWTFVLFLLSAVVFASAVPQADVPETSYNEVDTPITQAPPIVPSIRLVRPVVVTPIPVKEAFRAIFGVPQPSFEPESGRTRTRSDKHSWQDLLCSFLI